jgi:protein phosphatase
MEQRTTDSGFFSDKGPYRRRNEDVALCLPDSGIFIVADGLGGAAAGDRAARVATDTLCAALLDEGPPSALPEKLLPDGETRSVLQATMPSDEELENPEIRLNFAYQVAHFSVLAEGRSTGFFGMSAAMVVLWLTAGKGWIAHVGDCRAYLLRSAELTLLTEDHSLSTALAGRKSLPKGAIDSAFLRTRLTQVVGGEAAPVPDVYNWQPKAGCRILLCSDGVWGSLSEGTLRKTLGGEQPAEEACHILVDSAINAGSRDNATCLAVYF